jgi:type III pantothenate kinase
VTVDVVKDGVFQGGFIYPGLNAMCKTYKDISSALDYPFNFNIDLNRLPKNSTDAITYGYLKTLHAEVTSHNMNIVLTGGDAKEFAKIFPDAKVNEYLIFKGMKKILLHS